MKMAFREVVMLKIAGTVLSLALAVYTAASAREIAKPVPGLERVGHIIVIFLENRSFDNLYGMFPGADGIGNAGATAMQVADNGSPFDVLPAVLNNYTSSWIDT